MLARIGAAAVAAAMTALTIPAAHAMDETLVEANVTRPTANVSYADLNLAKSSDVAKLNARVKRAATRICFDRGSPDLGSKLDGMQCRDAALESAKPQITAAIARAGDAQLASNIGSGQSITVAMP